MVKLKAGNNTKIPLGEGMAILSLAPTIVFQKPYKGFITLKKYGEPDSKIVPSVQKVKVKNEEEVDLLSHKNFFIKVQNGLVYLDIEVSQPGELFYDQDCENTHPVGWSEPGQPQTENCPGCGKNVKKGDLMKHLMSGECKRD